MKITPFNFSGFDRSQKTRPSAFTLVEVMIAITVMIMTLAGVLAVQFYGMKLFELTKSKLGASDDARKAIDLLCTEIRSAKIIKIGNGGLGPTNFTECTDNTPQQGSAIQIYASTNTNTFVRYYWDSSTNQLQRTFNGITTKTVVASYITNSGVFTAEDAFGNTNTLKTANHVISMKLQFFQIQYPIIRIGPGNYYDFYQLSTKITKRT